MEFIRKALFLGTGGVFELALTTTPDEQGPKPEQEAAGGMWAAAFARKPAQEPSTPAQSQYQDAPSTPELEALRAQARSSVAQSGGQQRVGTQVAWTMASNPQISRDSLRYAGIEPVAGPAATDPALEAPRAQAAGMTEAEQLRAQLRAAGIQPKA